mmetsp:Transcript_39054/g.85617  ORF Transcript_39054/g.85617 Transcript_39054/m.85617 type:complete len:343 (-) Transcript_39054:374-1402(-)
MRLPAAIVALRVQHVHCLLLLLAALGLHYLDQASALAPKVLVTGASGRTGRLVFSKLNESPSYSAVGLVRSESSAKQLMRDVPNCGLDQLVIVDVTEMDGISSSGSDNSNEEGSENENGTVPHLIEGAEAMIICTSAVPKISKVSVIKEMLKIPLNLMSNKPALNFRGFRFRYKPGQHPEIVDYEGQKKQVDLAKKLGVKRVVVVSSMGGTDENNFLNTIGKNKDGTGNGDILVWKRKAEKYLVESGLDYTIIHPGGLLDTPAGQQKLVLDVDDTLLANDKRSISREDVANLCVAALEVGKDGGSISFDCIATEVEDGTEIVPAKAALQEFMKRGVSTDYSL